MVLLEGSDEKSNMARFGCYAVGWYHLGHFLIVFIKAENLTNMLADDLEVVLDTILTWDAGINWLFLVIWHNYWGICLFIAPQKNARLRQEVVDRWYGLAFHDIQNIVCVKLNVYEVFILFLFLICVHNIMK